MDLLVVIVLLTLILSVTTLPIDNKTEHAVVVNTLDIVPVWPGDPVLFALLIQASYQFIAYYDVVRQMTEVQRNLNERMWTTTKLGITTDWDAHKSIRMAINDDSYLHLSGNLHATPLIYFRTASTFVKLNRRESPDCSSNHALSYARSKDLLLNWPWDWDFHGDDTQNFAITFSPVVKRNDGDLTQEFNHIIFGNGTWSIDPETMRATGKFQRETISPSLLKVKGTFPGLEVRLVEDSGQYDITDTRFLIR